jgi:hypothetical protein
MRRSARWLPAEPLAPPAGLRAERLCLLSYHRPVQGCPTYVEYFKEGDAVPSRLCPIHQGTVAESVHRGIQGLLGLIRGGLRRIVTVGR